MSPVSAFPTQPREGQPPPATEVQKQTLLDYLWGPAIPAIDDAGALGLQLCHRALLLPGDRAGHLLRHRHPLPVWRK